MNINPQMIIQMLMNRNPQLFQQFQQFQQKMQTDSQLQQQFNNFKKRIMNDPKAQEKALGEAFNKLGMGASNPEQK